MLLDLVQLDLMEGSTNGQLDVLFHLWLPALPFEFFASGTKMFRTGTECCPDIHQLHTALGAGISLRGIWELA